MKYLQYKPSYFIYVMDDVQKFIKNIIIFELLLYYCIIQFKQISNKFKNMMAINDTYLQEGMELLEGRFRVLKRLGTGSFGEIYKVEKKDDK